MESAWDLMIVCAFTVGKGLIVLKLLVFHHVYMVQLQLLIFVSVMKVGRDEHVINLIANGDVVMVIVQIGMYVLVNLDGTVLQYKVNVIRHTHQWEIQCVQMFRGQPQIIQNVTYVREGIIYIQIILDVIDVKLILITVLSVTKTNACYVNTHTILILTQVSV